MSSCAGLNPVFPSTGSDSSENSMGRQLMALVRSVEKDSRTEQIHELSDLLQHLIAVYARRGLLQGNQEKARKLLESSNAPMANSAGVGAPRRGLKRNSYGDNIKSSLVETDQAVEDEALILSALLRILCGAQKSMEVDNLVVALAADVCLSISEHVKATSNGTCSAAEREILLSSSRSLLVGLASTMKGLASIASRTTRDTLALTSCLCATTSFITLLGRKIARSGSSLSVIRQVGWSGLMDRDSKVQQLAALLLSSMPLATGSSNPPAEEWSLFVMDGIAALGKVLDSMAPVRNRSLHQIGVAAQLSEQVDATITSWIQRVRDSTEHETDRMEAFRSYIQGLSFYVISLITRETYEEGANSVMIAARFPVEHALNLVDTMVSFPSAAESLFFSTKKRLRLEKVAGGLLSPTCLVFNMANLVKSLGHDILDATLSCIGGPSLLPFARRIKRIASSSLLASSSSALQKLLDPTSISRLTENPKKWLRTSVVLRTKTIETYGSAIRTLGPSVLAACLSDTATLGVGDSQDDSRSISSIGGSLLEQLAGATQFNDAWNEDWAHLCERVKLSTTALSALSSIVTTGGGYLSAESRSTIDSIVLSCISSVRLKTRSKVAVSPSVSYSILKVGSACLCTPWPDGAMSSTMDGLKAFAESCTRDNDNALAAEANACVRMCNSLAMPRVPALAILTRTDATRGGSRIQTSTAASLIEDLKGAWEEVSTSKTSTGQIGKEENDKKRQKAIESKVVEDTDIRQEVLPQVNDWREESHDAPLKHVAVNGTPADSAARSSSPPPMQPGHSDVVTAGDDKRTNDEVLAEAKSLLLESMPTVGKEFADQKVTPVTLQDHFHGLDQCSPEEDNDNSDDDDFLPEIVNCDPDEEDR